MSILKQLSISFRHKSESIATEQRILLGSRAFEPISAYTLASHLNARVVTPEQISTLEAEHLALLTQSSKWSAAIICNNPLYIVHNPAHSLPRRESNLMHELSHVLLNHGMVGFNPKTGLPQRKLLDEQEAIYLGACLQIPRRALLWAAQQNLTHVEIAANFGASLQMVKFRCNMTGIKLGAK